MWREPNGRELHAGRIYYGVVVSTDAATRWLWSVYGEHRRGRQAPHDGVVGSLDEAKAAFRRCWDSARPAPQSF